MFGLHLLLVILDTNTTLLCLTILHTTSRLSLCGKNPRSCPPYALSWPMSTPNSVSVFLLYRQITGKSLIPLPLGFSSLNMAFSFVFHVPILHSRTARPSECSAHLTIVFEQCFFIVQLPWRSGQRHCPQRHTSSTAEHAAPPAPQHRLLSSSALTLPTTSFVCSGVAASPTSQPPRTTSSTTAPHSVSSSTTPRIIVATVATTSQRTVLSPRDMLSLMNRSSRFERQRRSPFLPGATTITTIHYHLDVPCTSRLRHQLHRHQRSPLSVPVLARLIRRLLQHRRHLHQQPIRAWHIPRPRRHPRVPR